MDVVDVLKKKKIHGWARGLTRKTRVKCCTSPQRVILKSAAACLAAPTEGQRRLAPDTSSMCSIGVEKGFMVDKYSCQR